MAPLYIVLQNTTTPKIHISVAMRVAYGMRVRHESQPPRKNRKLFVKTHVIIITVTKKY